jgi:serine/threonine protein kinase
MPEPGAALPVKKAIELAIPVLDALAFLHSQNLLHRDVKPSNILISNGRLVLGDIGLLTRPREDLTCVCSPGFAPAGSVKDRSGDLYSVGMILHESVGGDVSATGLSISDGSVRRPGSAVCQTQQSHTEGAFAEVQIRGGDEKRPVEDRDKDAKRARKRQASAGSNRADPIELKYEETGGRHGFLGKPQERTRKCDDGAGKCRRFRNKDNIDGAIFWHPETGAFELHGEILKRWSELGGIRPFSAIRFLTSRSLRPRPTHAVFLRSPRSLGTADPA